MEPTNHLGRHGVHDVTHQSDGTCNGDGLVYEGDIVAYGVAARRFARLVHAQNVIAPFGKRQEKRK